MYEETVKEVYLNSDEFDFLLELLNQYSSLISTLGEELLITSLIDKLLEGHRAGGE